MHGHLAAVRITPTDPTLTKNSHLLPQTVNKPRQGGELLSHCSSAQEVAVLFIAHPQYFYINAHSTLAQRLSAAVLLWLLSIRSPQRKTFPNCRADNTSDPSFLPPFGPRAACRAINQSISQSPEMNDRQDFSQGLNVFAVNLYQVRKPGRRSLCSLECISFRNCWNANQRERSPRRTWSQVPSP